MLYVSLNHGEVELAQPGANGLPRFWKQLAYTGNFVKVKPDGTSQTISLSQELFNWWHQYTVPGFKAEGIDIPLPVGHTMKPEARRGKLLETKLGLDKLGRSSIFGLIEFAKPEYADLSASNVSVFAPETFTSGNGKTYPWPLQHVAITDYPVLPGLEPFDMALSLDYSLTLGGAMTLRDLATKLGIPATVPEDQLLAQMDAKITAMQTPPAPPAPPVAPPAPRPPAPPMMPPRPPVAASIISMARNSRKQTLTSLTEKGFIATAVAKELEEQYCSDDSLQLAMSADDADGDNFDGLVKILEKNERVVGQEKTGPQAKTGTVALSKEDDANEDDLMIRAAQKRADAAKAAKV
jgi:hypothetical protein